MAKTGYEYDDHDFLTAQGSSIPQFDATNYGSTFYYRGNVWKIRQYEIGTSNYKDSKIGYNTTGSVILTRDPLNHDTEIAYDTSYLAYPLTVTDPDGNHADVEYNFYTGQKTRTKSPTPDSGTWSYGVRMDYVYDSIDRLYTATRVKKVSGTDTNDANTSYYYATTGTNVTNYTTIKDLSTYTVTSTITDGAGRTIATATEHPGSSGGYKAQTAHYDIMGRADQTSNPTEISSGFAPYGDDYTAGWQYTEQTYDWKGRPLVTTHPDSTTRTASYSGCGCAGGDVVTLQDEGTMISSTLTRRKQVITKDVLGRVIQADIYNWNGSTIYSSTVSDYNALDQVISTKQYNGDPEATSPAPVYQETTFAYDGYGRLYYSRRPDQTANTYYSYYADDRLYRRTDGRGAYRNFTYNDRGLLTGITYGSTVFGMTLPVTVSFDYDGAGNRTSMEDGQGTVSYEYDQLSRMTSETRDFDDTLSGEPAGGYKLAYTYHLNGSLASLTDPFNDEIDYAINESGLLTGVTGSSYGGITNYADNAQYRASGVLKHLEYGNGQEMDATFNSRMAPVTYQVTDGTHNVLSKEYEYYNTGQVRYSQDLLNAKFDRLYAFDQVGRIESAKSGAEARGSTDSLSNIPYRQTYAYDAFNHLTGRTSNHWIATYSISDTYTDDRNDNWTYDAAGNVLTATDQTNTLDAAEQVTKVEVTGDSRTMQDFDGAGQVVHQRAENWNAGTSSYYTISNKYLIRSTVLGGAVVTETDPDGYKVRTFVRAGGVVVAWQTDGTYMGELVNWMHQEPGGASSRSTDSTGAIVTSGLYGAGAEAAELDAVGADNGTVNPYTDPDIPPDDGTGSSSQSSTAFGAPWHPRSTYSVDGLRVEPEFYLHFSQWNHVSPFTGLLFAAERSVDQFLYYRVHQSNGENTFVSSNFGDKMMAVYGAIELHGTAQAVWLAGVWNLSVSAISLTNQNPAPHPTGEKKPLNQKNRTEYDRQRFKLLWNGIPKKCAQFLMDHGISPIDVMQAISLQQPMSGTASTVSRSEAGDIDLDDDLWIKSDPRYKSATLGQTIKDEFDGSNLVASTGIFPGGQRDTSLADRSTVYFSGGGFKAIFLFHEAIHSVTGLGDTRLAAQLGIPDGHRTSQAITQVLIDHGCKW